ncbi:MAG TPA: DEAD/DEAH box helicase [Polyangiaceae bacterium]|nr:DEAD/DEAH box helicase [Polyangiaceae bacterium]
MTFTSLGLSEPLLRAIAELSYQTPTAVQAAAIPAILRGRDVWASAQTGSGKTAAFVLPILQRLSQSRGESSGVRALVLVPTRELALQIERAAQGLRRYLPASLKICVALGGVSINPQMMALRGGADLLVATPGRLLELAHCNAARLASLETLVLDEADRMFSQGFAKELAEVLALLPAKSQKLLFSATFPEQVATFAERLLHDPERITVDAGPTPGAAFIEQRAVEVDTRTRTPLLRHLLQTHDWPSVLVFVASRHSVEHVASKLTRAGFSALPLHGELSQGARTQALDDLKSLRVRVVVATDLAARGLDVAGLSAVINYDLPRSPTDYAHRIGRTGRAGESGVAISFIAAEGAAHFRLIEKRNELALPRERIAGFEPTDVAPVAPEAPLDVNGGVKGKRKSKKDKLREAANKTGER